MLFPLYDQNPHRRWPWVTILLIVVNSGILASQGWEPSLDTVYRFGFIPKRLSRIGDDKPLSVPVLERNAEGRIVPDPRRQPFILSTAPPAVYVTFLTMMFLHGNWLHLVMNMWMLWIFGNNVEDHLGRFLYLCFYLLGGMVGTVCQWAAAPDSIMPVIGASGAVAAVLGGYAITFPKAVVKTLLFFGLIMILDLPALLVLAVWFILQMVAGLGVLPGDLGGQHVAFWAHIGGFLAGMVLMPILSLGAAPPDADWKREVQELFQFDDPRSRIE